MPRADHDLLRHEESLLTSLGAADRDRLTELLRTMLADLSRAESRSRP